MKLCPACRRTYPDETLNFCLDDGSSLVYRPLGETNATPHAVVSEAPTQAFKSNVKPVESTRSIAILPFANMSGDVDIEYFCDGLAEEILNSLSKIDGLKVAARTSAFSFKNTNPKVADVGRALNVRNVLEGSVRRSGQRLRITVQLVNVTDGYHVWSKRFDREMKDVFEIQDEITSSVIAALKLKLFNYQAPLENKRGTANTDAYEAYLKGLYYRNKLGAGNVKTAIDYFQKSIALDSKFALAYNSLAEGYRIMMANGVLEPRVVRPKAEALIATALELDPELAEAYSTLSALHQDVWRFQEAMVSVERSIELNPYVPTPRIMHAGLLSIFGRTDEALEEAEIARDMDPLSLRAATTIGWVLYSSRRFTDGIEFFKEILKIEPGYSSPHFFLGQCLTANGFYNEALESYENAISLDPDSTGIYLYRASLNTMLGNHEIGRKMINDLQGRVDYVSPGELAIYYVATGEHNHAFELLEQAFEEHDPQLQYIGFDPLFDSVRDDARFVDLMRRVGIPGK